MEIKEKKVDPQGRVTLPIEWRKKALKKNRKILILEYPDYIKIVPKKRKKLTEFFDTMEVELKSSLEDYHKVKTELLSEKHIS